MTKSTKNLTLPEIISSIGQKKFFPLYLLHGEEPYFIDKISDLIEKSALPEAEKSFNQVVFYGKDTDAQTVVDAARRYPMMSPYQVIIVKEAQDMNTLEKLISYVNNPSPTTILVICHKYKKMDGRSLLAKAFDSNVQALIFESKSLRDNQIPEWIKEELKSRRLTATGDALFLLAENLGSDLGKITNEIEKLALNLPEQAQITVRDIEEQIGISKEYNIFELQKALAVRDAVKSYKIAAYFRSNPKNNPIVVVLASLYGFFSKLLAYQYTKEHMRARGQEASDKALMEAMQLKSEFMLRDYKQAAQHYSKNKSAQIIGFLKEYDLRSKGINNGSADHYDLIEELIFKIIN